MSNKRTVNSGCTCGCNKSNLVLTVTQLENQTVLEPENLENRDKILVLSRNINNAYMVKVMSTLTVKAMAEAIEDFDVAFLLVEMTEPAAPVDPGTDPGTTTDPENPGGTTETPGTTPDPENPDNTGGTGDTTGDDPAKEETGNGGSGN